MKPIELTSRLYRRFGPLIAVIALGLLATALSWQYLRGREQELKAAISGEARGEHIDVVVPVRPLAAGEVLRDDMVARRNLPVDHVHPDALRPDGIDAFIGRKLTLDAAPGRPLLASFFTVPQRVFAEQIEPGVRAMTIAVDEVSSISGMLRAGDRIDFMYMPRREGSQPDARGQEVVPLLQDVQVRATGQITAEAFAAARKQPDGATESDPYRQQGFTTVTVALPLKDSQMLILAQRLGSLIAVLRNPDDRQSTERGMTAQDLSEYVERFNQRKRTVPVPRVVSAARDLPRRDIEFIVGGHDRGEPDFIRQAMQGFSQPGAGAAGIGPAAAPATTSSIDNPAEARASWPAALLKAARPR